MVIVTSVFGQLKHAEFILIYRGGFDQILRERIGWNGQNYLL